MATMKWYAQAHVGMVGATAARRFDWVTDTIKVMLATSAYTPDQDAHDFRNDVTAVEVANGGGYTTGGVTLSGKSVTYASGTKRTQLKASNISWTITTSLTARYAIAYKDTGAAATDPLLGYSDFGSDQTVSAGTFGVDWDATDGVLYIEAL